MAVALAVPKPLADVAKTAHPQARTTQLVGGRGGNHQISERHDGSPARLSGLRHLCPLLLDALPVADCELREQQMSKRVGKIGIDRECLEVILDRILVLFEFVPRIAAIVPGLRAVGADCQSFAERRYSRFVLPDFRERDASIVPRFSRMAIVFQIEVITFDGLAIAMQG